MGRLISARTLIVLIVGTGLATAANADTITVCWDGSGDYLTIQEGIDAASNGDEVVVCDGTYTGDGNRDIDYGGRLITVRSENGPENCVIDCEGDESDPHRAFILQNGETSDAVLEGLTIQNGYIRDGNGGAVYCDGASPTFRNCILERNTATATSQSFTGIGGGVFCQGGSPMFEDCRFERNTVLTGPVDYTAMGGGVGFVSVGPGEVVTFSRCTFSDNLASCEASVSFAAGGGVVIYSEASQGTRAVFNTCEFLGNEAHGVEQGTGNGGGVAARLADVEFVGCRFVENRLTAANGVPGGGAGAWLYVDYNEVLIEGCEFERNTSDFIGAALWFGCLWLSHTAPQIRNCTFTDNAALGGGAIYNAHAHPDMELCTFTGNRCTGTSGHVDSFLSGGAISQSFDATGSVTGCRFVDNHSARYGGAVYNSERTAVRYEDCEFVRNTADLRGGGTHLYWSQSSFIQCSFQGNTASLGGAVYSFGVDELPASIHNSDFVGNQADNGGGVYTTTFEGLTISGCTFVSNSAADGGGGIYGDPTVVNCILWDSNSNQIDGNPAVTYSDVQDGTGEPWFGTGCIDSDPLFWGGPSGTWTADAVYDPYECKTMFTDASAGWEPDALVGKFLNPDTSQYLQSLVTANTPTTLTVWGDFEELGTTGNTYQINDYHLTSGSPCIDAADNTAVPADEADLDGDGDTAERIPVDLDWRLRFADRQGTIDTGVPDPPGYPYVVDMGTYEYQCSGDLDGDGDIDLSDLAQLLANYGTTSGASYADGDIDLDGDVDLSDLAALLAVYGTTCP